PLLQKSRGAEAAPTAERRDAETCGAEAAPTGKGAMLKVGLTGGIASGKSTVARLFEELGVPIVDTDVIAREVVEPGEPALAAVRDVFGDDVLTAEGTLDRRALRSRVFADPAARRQLEALLHPLIRARTLTKLEAL